MATKNWMPRGFVLSDGSRVKKLLASTDDWQITSTSTEGFALVVKLASLEADCSPILKSAIILMLFFQVSTDI